MTLAWPDISIRVANPQLLSRVADISPETICGNRYAMAFCRPARLENSGYLVDSPQVKGTVPRDIFGPSGQQELERWRDVFAELSPF